MARVKAATVPEKPRSATAEQILDVAETLIQTRSYAAFSYQDIADALGIRKASIHYHFASKAELGAAVIDRYAARFGAALKAFEQDRARSSMALLDFYTEPYLQFGKTDDRACLCGALAGEVMSLPAEMRAKVERFFKSHQAWLTAILERGVKSGEFRLVAPAAKTARLVLAALQGALLVKRATGDSAQLKDVVAVLKSDLAAG
jgi:TetR/AcrR family transcriptional repressor of nem operon